MSLFFSLLPLYLFGNLHCLGMCGPLVMLISRNPHRLFYFWGRICSFSLAGLLAGMSGEVVQLFLQDFSVSALPSLLLGGWILLIASQAFPKWIFTSLFHSTFWKKIEKNLALLALYNSPKGMFFCGMSTLLLPCGQTLIVFAACALTPDPRVGLGTGFAFPMHTSPSLWFALKMGRMLSLQKFPRYLISAPQTVVGLLICCRGFAELGWIPHLILYQSDSYHFSLF